MESFESLKGVEYLLAEMTIEQLRDLAWHLYNRGENIDELIDYIHERALAARKLAGVCAC